MSDHDERQMDAMMDSPEPDVEEEQLQEAPKAAFSKEEMDEGAREAGKLAAGNPYINLACSALILSRQLYAAARQDLTRWLKKSGAKPATEEVLVRAMAHKAEKELYDGTFTDEVLANKMAEIGLNFVQSFVRTNMQEESVEEAGKAAAEAQERQELDIELYGDRVLARKRTLLIFGDKTVEPAFKNILEAVSERNTVPKTRKTVVLSLDANAPAQLPLNRAEDKLHWCPSSLATAGLCNSDKELAQGMAGFLKHTYKNRVDLVMVPDVTHLVTRGIIADDPWSAANSAHKRLREWCNKNGCGLILGLPHDHADFKTTRLAPHVSAIRTIDNLYEEFP